MPSPLPHTITDQIIRVSLADCVLRGLQSHEISEGLFALIETAQTPRLLVSLNDIEQMTSVTLAGLLQAHHRAQLDGGQLRLCDVGKNVHSVLQMTRLGDVLHVDSDEQTAIAQLKAQ